MRSHSATGVVSASPGDRTEFQTCAHKLLGGIFPQATPRTELPAPKRQRRSGGAAAGAHTPACAAASALPPVFQAIRDPAAHRPPPAAPVAAAPCPASPAGPAGPSAWAALLANIRSERTGAAGGAGRSPGRFAEPAAVAKSDSPLQAALRLAVRCLPSSPLNVVIDPCSPAIPRCNVPNESTGCTLRATLCHPATKHCRFSTNPP